MPDVTEKIFERIPYFDGGFRRRVTSGAILATSSYFSFDTLSDSEFISTPSSNITLLIIIFLMIYAIGNLVELVAEVFISKLIGKAISFPLFRMRRADYLERVLGAKAYNFFECLPDSVKRGLENPFGRNKHITWNYFSTCGTPYEMKLAKYLRERNQDVLVIVTAISIAIFILLNPVLTDNFSTSWNKIQEQSQNQVIEIAWQSAVILVFILGSIFPTIFFGAYLSSVRSSIITLLEYKALRANIELNASHNQRVDPTVKTPVESGNEQGTAGHP